VAAAPAPAPALLPTALRAAARASSPSGAAGGGMGGSDDGGGDKEEEEGEEGEEDEDDDDCGEGEDLFAGLPARLPPRAAAAAGGGGGGAARPPRPKFADGATVIDTGEGLSEVAVGRWHTAKGRVVRAHEDGLCRMFLVDCLPWMEVTQAEPEGALLCPGCRTKLGLFSLGGLKCSCGLAVAPGFKIPKSKVRKTADAQRARLLRAAPARSRRALPAPARASRAIKRAASLSLSRALALFANRAQVDATLHGINTLEVALAAASMEERGADLGGLLSLARPGEAPADEDAGDGEAHEREKTGMRVPVSKHRGNFSLFRNKST